VDTGGRVIGWVPPRFSTDGYLYWARHPEGTPVEVCRLGLDDDVQTCISTEAVAIQGLAPVASGVKASVLLDGKTWEIKEFAF
jgi:hypothetical protein